MLDQQASNIGCNSKLYSEGWATKSLIEDSVCYSHKYLDRKIKEGFFLNSQKILEDHVSQPCVPEIFSIGFCELDKRNDLVEDVSVLEAFQTYAISLYDQIEDNHIFRNGSKTVLGEEGLIKTKKIKQGCEEIFRKFSKKLEKRILYATEIANKQYHMTLRSDSIRNKKKIMSPEDAILLQDYLAGIPTEYIAKLCGGSNEIKMLAKGIGNSLSTLDDLIDLLNLSDIESTKTTIPLSYLNKFNLWSDTPVKTRDNFIRSNAFLETLRYLDAQLGNAREVLEYLDPSGKNLLTKYTKEMKSYIIKLKNVK